jgi:hypothetical protein
MLRRVFYDFLEDARPVDFIMVIIATLVGFIFSLISNVGVAIGAAVTLLVLFGVGTALAIWDIKSDYIRLIDREFKKRHWHNVCYLGLPICATLRRMTRYKKQIEVAKKIIAALSNIEHSKLDLDEIGRKYSNMEKIMVHLHIDDLGYTYFLLKNIELAKGYVHLGINIAKKHNIQYGELSGYLILLQMQLIDASDRFFTGEERENIFNNFIGYFSNFFSGTEKNIPPSESSSEYIPYLKSLHMKILYEHKFKKISDDDWITQMKILANALKEVNLIDKYFHCTRMILIQELRSPDASICNAAEVNITEIIENAFNTNIALTTIEYIKYVTVYLEYFEEKLRQKRYHISRTSQKNIKYLKDEKNRLAVYIRSAEKEIGGMDDPCVEKFYKVKKELKATIQACLVDTQR